MPFRIEIQEAFYSIDEAILSLRVIAKELEEGKISSLSEPAWWMNDGIKPHVVNLPPIPEAVNAFGPMTAPQQPAQQQSNNYDNEKLTDDSIMIFGKHKGKTLAEIPDSWLSWWFDANKGNENTGYYSKLSAYIKENLNLE